MIKARIQVVKARIQVLKGRIQVVKARIQVVKARIQLIKNFSSLNSGLCLCINGKNILVVNIVQ